MALREDDCFLVRRFAVGGIDKNIVGSRADGKDRFYICRFATRGYNDKDDENFVAKRQQKVVQDNDLEDANELVDEDGEEQFEEVEDDKAPIEPNKKFKGLC
ncbi:hypothetical protein QVD17_17032 [Tagetes erecta]|uniref:Uncharacterized protein n=1 Tax=Tagetes erecta TaxID=13708 RepID=A0AAD8KSF2_TARER|nr:hypothetical protein QVD17_17032 [Tagetes erecta]